MMRWRSKIVGHAKVAASELLANPFNHRKHPENQRKVIAASVAEVGFVKSVLVNRTTGHIIDGHERVAQASLASQEVDVEYVELSAEDEKKALLILDASASMATVDACDLSSLISECDFAFDDLADFAQSLAKDVRVEDDSQVDDEDPIEQSSVCEQSLEQEFTLPFQSVLNARNGWWQSRKKQWFEVGIKSELGRGEYADEVGDTYGSGGILMQSWSGHPRFYTQKQEVEKKLGRKITTEEFKEKYFTIPDDQLKNDASVFDPVLCEAMYRWFAPKGGKVVDPFSGGSVRGIVASKLGLEYVGCDLRSEQVAENIKQWAGVANKTVVGSGIQCVDPQWICADSRSIDEVCKAQFDFVFSCPPYFDLEVYSDDQRDLSNMEYPAFLEAYRQIISKSCSLLKPDRFAVFVVGEVRDKKGVYRNLVGETIDAFQNAGLTLFRDGVLVISVSSLWARAGKVFQTSRKLGKTHQNILVFYKGDQKKAFENIARFK